MVLRNNMTHFKKRGNKEQYVPYKNNGTSCSISYGFTPLLDKNGNETHLGEWYTKTYNRIPTKSEIQQDILSFYNEKISEKILKGLRWKNMQIWLSTENQYNYKAAYDIAVQTEGKNLPVIFKLGDSNSPIYYEFKTVEELTDFYVTVWNFIQETLVEGWKTKDNIDWKLYE